MKTLKSLTWYFGACTVAIYFYVLLELINVFKPTRQRIAGARQNVREVLLSTEIIPASFGLIGDRTPLSAGICEIEGREIRVGPVRSRQIKEAIESVAHGTVLGRLEDGVDPALPVVAPCRECVDAGAHVEEDEVAFV